VVAVDRAPLDPRLDRRANVEWRGESAFALEPSAVGTVDWLCSDVIAYPQRLLTLAERWLQSGCARNLVMTVKFQGETDHDAARAFSSLPNAQLFHLHHNRHELTFVALADESAAGDG
jgi:23S rRNA (cytidine2498-2'-O)-methyltransferase